MKTESAFVSLLDKLPMAIIQMERSASRQLCAAATKARAPYDISTDIYGHKMNERCKASEIQLKKILLAKQTVYRTIYY